jgi:segregation and condensation protein A
MMREMDLEVAGEFISMAATLIHIKSQMLLPHYNEQGEEIIVEDPRKVLVQKLIEYQKYQEAASLLSERPWLGRDVYPRGVNEKFESAECEMELDENALFGLIASFRRVIRAAEKRVHKVTKKLQSIASRINELKSMLVLNVKVPLRSLLQKVKERRAELLITFLSALEMAKMGFVRLFQTDNFEEIYIEVIKNLDELSLSRIEEYETNPQDVLEKLETKAIVELNDESLDQLEVLNILEGDDELQDEEMGFGFDASQEVATDEDIKNAEIAWGLEPQEG